MTMQTTRLLRRSKLTAAILSASFLTLFLVGLSPLPQLLAATSTASTALNPVQVSIQTKNLTSVSSYDLVGYNSTGAAVASYTGQYQRVTFDLPSGTYLFAATVNGPYQSQSSVCCMCGQKGQVVGGVVASPPAKVTPSGSAANTAIAYPCYYSNPPLEFGYS